MAKDKGDKHPDESFDPAGEGAAEGEPVVRDKRRIDPETGDVRDLDETTEVDLDDELQRLLAGEDVTEQVTDASGSDPGSEHLADLKRVTAEYANYRKRVERDRSVARELALAEMALSLLPVLDDLDLAEAHGDLPEGSPVALVAQKLRATMERHGLTRVSPAGERFDPMQHEAIAHIASDVDPDTIVDVAVVGYHLGDRLLRPAKVVVSAAKE
ncbi:MAG: nucleotide exchange factor GrpE [Cryobacterium sp.]|nr:nucleotide exchange factor GrpE [Cryobacterium sp.]